MGVGIRRRCREPRKSTFARRFSHREPRLRLTHPVGRGERELRGSRVGVASSVWRAWCFARMDEAVPLPRGAQEHRARKLRRTWAVVVLANRGPSLKPSRGGEGIDARSPARDALVLLVVLKAVHEGIAHLACAREIAPVVAIGPHTTSPAPCRRVEEAISAHGEALHAAGERIAVVGLDDEMEVIVLDGELDDAKVVAPRPANRVLEGKEQRKRMEPRGRRRGVRTNMAGRG